MKHGIICRRPDSIFGYFGWGSVASLGNGRLVAAVSGHRMAHVCPFGKTQLFYSFDEGESWSPPVVVNDTVLDDRDAGIVHLGGGRLLLTWFNHPLRYCARPDSTELKDRLALAYMDASAHLDTAAQGSHIRVSDDAGLHWGPSQKLEVSSPHGPCLLPDGGILYLGKVMYSDRQNRGRTDYQNGYNPIMAWRSADGVQWEELGGPALPPGTAWDNFHEPHAIALPNGRILGMLRYQDRSGKASPYDKTFSMFQTWSEDGGKTWSEPIFTGVSGSPPHLLLHSSGVIVCAYGRREAPFGERAMLSYDMGETWSRDIEICPAKDLDIGYPCSVELSDGSILTAYYQKYENDPLCSFLYTRWSL